MESLIPSHSSILTGLVSLISDIQQLFNLLASLGHTERRRVVLGHTLNTQTLTKTKKSHNVLSKLTILYWAAFIAILDSMQPAGRRLDTSGGVSREEGM